MGKRWMAAALAALALAGVAAAAPLAGASGKSAGRGNASPAGEKKAAPPETGVIESGLAGETITVADAGDDYVLVEIAESAGSLEEMRAAAVSGVAAEDRDAACYAVYRGLLSPGEDGAFRPEEPVTRGEAVAALYRLSGILVRVDGCPYPDVPEAYQDAVAWADAVGVSGGVSEDRFAPEEPVNRSQLAVMLHRFARWRKEDVTCNLAVSYDGQEVPAYAQEAVNWALDRGLFAGMIDHGLYPRLPVSRLQLARVLARLQRGRDPLAETAGAEAPTPVSLSRQNHEALSKAIGAAAKKWGAVGVQVAVIEHGAVTDTYNYGWAVKGKTPMTARHKMRVASLSKVMVGVSAALLREEGAVDYDENIGTYWGVKTRKPVTIRSILTHTSTLVNSESVAWDYKGVKAQLASASGYGGGTPGSLASWSYNNHAFGVLGMTLELASGRYLDDVLSDRLLTALEADGGFAAGDLKHPELITPLYRTNSLGRSAESMRAIHRWSTPGATGRQFPGGYTSSALDVAKVAAVLAGDGCFEGVRLMDAASVALMESHQWQAVPGGTYQALPLRHRLDAYGREGLYYHTGSAYGVYNLLSYDPSTGDGVVVLTMGARGTLDGYGIYAVCGEISRAVYDVI